MSNYIRQTQRDMINKAKKLEEQAAQLRALASGEFYVDEGLYASVVDSVLVTEAGVSLTAKDFPRFAKWLKRVSDAGISRARVEEEVKEEADDDEEWSDD